MTKTKIITSSLFASMPRQLLAIFSILSFSHLLWGQMDTVFLTNPSFEDFPSHSQSVKHWQDCGFIGESAPDAQPFGEVGNAIWGQLNKAIDGKTYLGMVVRDNDTYESVSQRLKGIIENGDCYKFSLFLCSSNKYKSQSRKTGLMENFTHPAVLRIYGGNTGCDRRELLAESPTIRHQDWRQYDFEFHPNGNYSYIMLEAMYKTPTLAVYNGNVLIDHASAIVQISCLQDDVVANQDAPTNQDEVREIPPKRVPIGNQHEPNKEEPTEEIEVATASTGPLSKPEKPNTQILTNLDRSKITKGQTIRIENLYFDADSTSIDSTSFDVLEEIAYFLSQNEDIIIEIGGHTNGRPPSHEFCDSLSMERAKSVASYLNLRGISNEQLRFHGYGKRKPIASNKTQLGRQRNQRVELRILSFEG